MTRRSRVSRFALLAGTGALALFGLASQLDGRDRRRTSNDDVAGVFRYDGIDREYVLHEPAGLRAGAPLVLALHGLGSNAAELEAGTGLSAVADEFGFGVLYAQGSLTPDGRQHWNANLTGSTGLDDVGFLTALAARLQAERHFDPERMFVFGLSNGGFMAYTLACEAPEHFARIAVIMATMSPGDYLDCSPSDPTPVLHIHGTDDEAVPIGGATAADGGKAPPVADVIALWASIDGTTSVETSHLGSSTTATFHRGGKAGSEVWYYRVDGLGHELPRPETGTDTMSLLVQFFGFSGSRR